jgi:hypothetical protein
MTEQLQREKLNALQNELERLRKQNDELQKEVLRERSRDRIALSHLTALLDSLTLLGLSPPGYEAALAWRTETRMQGGEEQKKDGVTMGIDGVHGTASTPVKV